MPPRKTAAALPEPRDSTVSRLAEVVETLSAEVRALAAAIDDIRMELDISCSYYPHFLAPTKGPGIRALVDSGLSSLGKVSVGWSGF